MQGRGEGLGRATPGVKGPASVLRDAPPHRGDAGQRDHAQGALPGAAAQASPADIAQRSTLGSSRAGAAAESLPRFPDQE